MSQNRSNTRQNDTAHDESEISLSDIVGFLKDSYKITIIFSLSGIIAAITYLAMTSKQFEASAQIAMAQISTTNNNNSTNPLGTNIEDPLLLIARLSSPTSFTPDELAACGFKDTPDAAAALAKTIKLVPAKGIPNVVDLKTFGASPEAAKACANAIFNFIKKTQAQIVAPYIDEVTVKLAVAEDRINKAKDLMVRSDKGGSAMGAAYLSTRDEIRYLFDEIIRLKDILASNQNRVTRLIAPIYASDLPAHPKKQNALAAGLFGGLFAGLLIALSRKMITKLNNQEGGVV